MIAYDMPVILKSFGLVFSPYTIYPLQYSARQHVQRLLQKYIPVNMDATKNTSFIIFIIFNE